MYILFIKNVAATLRMGVLTQHFILVYLQIIPILQLPDLLTTPLFSHLNIFYINICTGASQRQSSPITFSCFYNIYIYKYIYIYIKTRRSQAPLLLGFSINIIYIYVIFISKSQFLQYIYI